jgi:hypothetical protein
MQRMDLCLIFRRERLGIFCFLLLLENESLESMALNIGDREPQPRRFCPEVKTVVQWEAREDMEGGGET